MTAPASPRRRGPTTTQACGTYPGYMRHWRRKEPVCDACRFAENQYHQDRRLAPERRAILDAEVAVYDHQHRGERPS